MKVSVAMITYNHEKYVREAIDGILLQEVNFDFEIVIGEDASTDETRAIIETYIEKHPNKFNVRFHETNIGMMPNFMQTLNACQGKYIALCEGDDYWTDKNKLQKQVDFLDVNQDFAGCFHNVIAKDERHPHLKHLPWRNYTKDVFTLTDTFSKTSLFHTCSFVFRKTALETPEWFNHVKSGDMALFAVVASKGNLKLLPGNMSVYRKNDGGVTNNEQLKEYHAMRMLLWTHVNAHYNFKFKREIEPLLKFHKTEYNKNKTSIFSKIRRKLKV